MTPTTNQVIDELLDRLTAIQWESTDAFEVVAFHDDDNPLRALVELIANKASRVACLYFEGIDFKTESEPSVLQQRLEWLLTLYLADRHWSGRDPKASRGAVGFPGSHGLQDAVIEALSGKLVPGAVCALENARTILLHQEGDKDPTGRKAISLQFRVFGPTLTRKTVPQNA